MTEAEAIPPTAVTSATPGSYEAAPAPAPNPVQAAAAAPASAGAVGIRQLLEIARNSRASDVHLTQCLPPQMRVDGDLVLIAGGDACVSREWFDGALRDICLLYTSRCV